MTFFSMSGDAYLWLKALHLIAVIAWMAGLLYLPRLFVYHTAAGAGTPQAETFIVMEEKLLRIIMNPAMIVTWVLGLALAFSDVGAAAWDGGWFHAKLLLVVLMSGFHGFLAASRKRFAAGDITRSEKFWRLANEIPTVLMVFIVILVIVKPF